MNGFEDSPALLMNDIPGLTFILTRDTKTFNSHELLITYKNTSSQSYIVWSEAVVVVQTANKNYEHNVGVSNSTVIRANYTGTMKYTMSFEGKIQGIFIDPVNVKASVDLPDNSQPSYRETVDISTYQVSDNTPIVIGGIAGGLTLVLALAIILLP